jgi:hypothetical protein
MANDDYLGVVKNIYRAFSAGKLEEVGRYIDDDFQASFNAYGEPGLYKNALSYHAWDGISSGKELVEVLKRDLHEWTANERSTSLTFFVSEPEQATPLVVCVFEIDYIVRPTGKRVQQKKVHLWTLDKATFKVKRLEHFDDTAQVVDAFTP